MVQVPVAIVQLISAAVRSLSGPSLATFAGQITSRLGVTVSGSASAMANQLAAYVQQNPMAAGFTAGALASLLPTFDVQNLIDKWDESEGEMPGDVKYLLEQIVTNNEQREEVVGDGEADSVMGLEVDELRKAALILAHGDKQIDLLIDQFGDIDTVMAVRSALFNIEDEQLKLYKERHSAG